MLLPSHRALPMILSWQLVLVRAARHGNVAFAPGGSSKVRAQWDCHTPWGLNTKRRGSRHDPEHTRSLLPNLRRSGRIIVTVLGFFSVEQQKENWLWISGPSNRGLSAETWVFPNSLSGICSPVSLSIWSDCLTPAACSSAKMKNKLWKNREENSSRLFQNNYSKEGWIYRHDYNKTDLRKKGEAFWLSMKNNRTETLKEKVTMLHLVTRHTL